MIIEKDFDLKNFSDETNSIVIQMRLLGKFQAFLFFFYEEILHAQKSIKSIKSRNANKPTFTQIFFTRIKTIKSTKSDFHSDVFYAHKKHKKHKTSNKQFSSS